MEYEEVFRMVVIWKEHKNSFECPFCVNAAWEIPLLFTLKAYPFRMDVPQQYYC